MATEWLIYTMYNRLDLHIFIHKLLTNKQLQWEVSEKDGLSAPAVAGPHRQPHQQLLS